VHKLTRCKYLRAVIRRLQEGTPGGLGEGGAHTQHTQAAPMQSWGGGTAGHSGGWNSAVHHAVNSPGGVAFNRGPPDAGAAMNHMNGGYTGGGMGHQGDSPGGSSTNQLNVMHQLNAPQSWRGLLSFAFHFDMSFHDCTLSCLCLGCGE